MLNLILKTKLQAYRPVNDIQPVYVLGHPGEYLFLLYKIMLTGWTCTTAVSLNFDNIHFSLSEYASDPSDQTGLRVDVVWAGRDEGAWLDSPRELATQPHRNVS